MARRSGVPSYLIDGPADIDPAWFSGDETVLVTAGASAPENVVQECIALLRGAFRRGGRAVHALARRRSDFLLPPPLRGARRRSHLKINDLELHLVEIACDGIRRSRCARCWCG